MTTCSRQGRKMREACRATGAAAVCFVFLTTLTQGVSADYKDPTLEILPSQEIQTQAVGKALLLTCRPNVEDVGLISDLQWRDNANRTISGKNKSNRQGMHSESMPEQTLALFIPSLTEAMAGIYHCSANYANTQRLHVQVKIEVIIAITWKDAPENQYPIKGQDYKVKCDVSARPPPTISWIRNEDQIFTSGRYVLESKGLLIKNVTESDDGIYSCRAAVMHTGELSERNIKLEVHTLPTMEAMPDTVEVLEGDTSSITCVARGKPPPTFTWIKQTTQENLGTADRFTVNQHTGVLTMNKVDQSDIGPFACTAKNAAGTAEVVVDVQVLMKPKIFELLNVTSPVKTETRLICKANGRPAPSIAFRKYRTENFFISGPQRDDNRIIVDVQTNVEKGESTGTLTFTETMRSDDGLYECVATNKAESAYKNGHVTVEFPPTFEASIDQPHVWSWDQKPANLTCIAESIPNATIEWRLRDRPLIEERNMRIVGKGPSSTLMIIPVDQRYYTMYKCVATNKLGIDEHEIQLRLASIPPQVSHVSLRGVTATTASFTITSPGSDGIPLRAFIVRYKESRNYDWNLSKNKTWSIDSPYIVENLLPMFTYNFQFAAINDVGIGPFGAPQEHTMPKISYPAPPLLLLGGSTSETGAVQSSYADHYELRWKIPADNGEPIDVYKIDYCPVNKVNGEWTEISKSDCVEQELKAYENTAFEMNSLVPDTYYRIRLEAHNRIGYSPPGEIFMKTARGLDSMVPRHDGPALSSAAIIGIVIAGVLIMLIVVDLLLCCCRRQGVIATLCHRKSKQHEEDEAKLGRDEKEPLKDCNDRTMIDNSMMRNTSVEFDGRRVHAKTGDIIGKNSAV